tara:strand:- start:689 stop:1006 length:318 start_codon:yes stop_codon:yes gene_type:complete
MNIKDIKKLKGTDFEKSVWLEISKIPYGDISTYKNIALKLSKNHSARAVANACGKNPLIEIIPCHRVIRSDGFLGGYSGKGGIKKKKKLLEGEGHKFDFDLKIIV